MLVTPHRNRERRVRRVRKKVEEGKKEEKEGNRRVCCQANEWTKREKSIDLSIDGRFNSPGCRFCGSLRIQIGKEILSPSNCVTSFSPHSPLINLPKTCLTF